MSYITCKCIPKFKIHYTRDNKTVYILGFDLDHKDMLTNNVIVLKKHCIGITCHT
jgi:hypothetical protein